MQCSCTGMYICSLFECNDIHLFNLITLTGQPVGRFHTNSSTADRHGTRTCPGVETNPLQADSSWNDTGLTTTPHLL